MPNAVLYHIPFLSPNAPSAFLPLYVGFLGYSYPQEHIERPNGFELYQWFYCQKGTGEFVIDDRKALVREGECFFIPPRTGHSYHALSDEWTLHLIGFSGSCADEICRSCGMTEAGIYQISDRAIFDHYICEMLELLPKENSSPTASRQVETLTHVPDEDLYALSGLCYRLLIDLRNRIDHVRLSETAAASPTVKEIISYLEAHFSEAVSLSDLSDRLHLSREYLCTLFRREMGYTIHRHLTILRISHAITLLERYPEMKVADISRRSGYDSPSYFGKQFKMSTGMTPEQYRMSRLM